MKFPPELANEIQARLDRAKKLHPGSVSKDGKAVCIEGSIGHNSYVSPDGDVFLEVYDIGSDEPPFYDRSRSAQIAVLVLGSETIPKLAEMLPERPPEAPICEKCNGSGWILQGLFRSSTGGKSKGILCDECSGLGWIEESS